MLPRTVSKTLVLPFEDKNVKVINNLVPVVQIFFRQFSKCRLYSSSDIHLQPQRSNLYVDNLPSAFIPAFAGHSAEDVAKLQEFVQASHRLFIITGAGLSTESGIPDYRSEGVGLYARSNHRPINYQDFLKSAKTRQRYWARNFTGWSRYSSFQPNLAHVTLSRWEAAGKSHWLVTQNVDGLHIKAGSVNLTELHGSLYRVVCLSCKSKMRRHKLQTILESLNPHWKKECVEIAPDGDVQLTQEQVEGFVVPPCAECGGILKPDIVFFGDNVAKATVQLLFNKLQESDSVLVLGSSLQIPGTGQRQGNPHGCGEHWANQSRCHR
ncbi:NAD-dependent protein lipoamidase sirtuin-4, mitochondrial-like isoform X2 [Liolophura sinensis]|uniref:NAD-dependent protein lipoamidase sirtuin-4, mitochondrial-like isoform X2 n=1 Tax=Liolophura sinensis TaxID=3198878 RepID=UPI003158B525